MLYEVITFKRLQFIDQYRDDFEKISDETIIAIIEDWRLGILIDCYDSFRVTNACQMLNCPGYATGNVKIRAGLPAEDQGSYNFV